jgi:hypothetical protein
VIRHVTLFQFSPDATDEQRRYLEARLAELPELIPTVRSFAFGSDLGASPGNHDFAVTAEFDSVEGYQTYRDHPAHQAFIADCLEPIRVARAAAQFELP